MGFAPLEEIEGPIELTLRGKTYTLPVLTMQQGLELQARIAEGITAGELAMALLGPVMTELADDGASAALVDRVAAVAIAEWQFGREAAERAWADPKSLTEQIAAYTAAIQAAARAAATTTPPQASGSTTKTPKKRARRSPGPTSSGTSA